jgi:protein subunit release factor A
MSYTQPNVPNDFDEMEKIWKAVSRLSVIIDVLIMYLPRHETILELRKIMETEVDPAINEAFRKFGLRQ